MYGTVSSLSFITSSQLIVLGLNLRRLQQTAHLGSSFVVCSQLLLVLLLLLNSKQLGIVAGELLERDQEITKVQSELVILVVEANQTLDEKVDLGTMQKLALFEKKT